ncbi:MAG: GNAT family N-acetyltransferase [Thermoanaerobaculia bacterium]
MFDHLDTPRLRLRRFERADLPALLAYRNDPEVARYQSWESFTEADGEAFIEAQSRSAPGQPGLWFQFAITVPPDRRLVGDCGLHVGDDGVAEIGFTLSREGQGRGFGAEAVREVIRYAFRELGMQRIQAIVDARNEAAIRLLRRVGLLEEKQLARWTWFKNARCIEQVFAIGQQEWPEIRQA